MKQLLTKISTFVMALLVLFSTFSFTVEKHYCGDFLMDFSVVGKAKDCGMEMEAKASAKKKSCCKDEVQKFEGQDELQQNFIDEFSFEKQQFVAAFFISYQDLFILNESKTLLYKDFHPPDIPLDYQVFYQTFLI